MQLNRSEPWAQGKAIEIMVFVETDNRGAVKQAFKLQDSQLKLLI